MSEEQRLREFIVTIADRLEAVIASEGNYRDIFSELDDIGNDCREAVKKGTP